MNDGNVQSNVQSNVLNNVQSRCQCKYQITESVNSSLEEMATDPSSDDVHVGIETRSSVTKAKLLRTVDRFLMFVSTTLFCLKSRRNAKFLRFSSVFKDLIDFLSHDICFANCLRTLIRFVDIPSKSLLTFSRSMLRLNYRIENL